MADFLGGQQSHETGYFFRKEIEENSPSRRDGIGLKKENFLRKSYCTFLQHLGKTLKVPQITIATAIIFCHRFFLRQSHAKNDRRIIATVCMFLAGKVEESFRPLRDVVIVSYQIIYKKDAAAVQRIKQREIYEKQKELVLLGERIVLTTLGFDLNIRHPYKHLVVAIKKYEVVEEKKNTLAQVAWNFVNDGLCRLRTSLSLQFKPHQIAAGALFLAAKFLKVELITSEGGEKSWWLEFDGVTQRQLADISNQMLEMYELQKEPPLQPSETSGITDCRENKADGTCLIHEREAVMPKGDSSVGNEVTTTIVSVVKKDNSEDAVKKLDIEKLRSNFERRKSCGEINRETKESLDEIERELEDVEVPSGNKSIEGERNQCGKIVSMEVGDDEFDSVDIEEVEVAVSDDVNDNYRSPPVPRTRKRKAE